MRREGPTPCAITAVGIATALGVGLEATWTRLVEGDQSRLSVRDDLVPRRAVVVGQILEPLAPIPTGLARYACRTNALSLTALTSILPSVRAAIGRVGAARVGVVMGSTTSGVDAAEAAVEQALLAGPLPDWFDYAQLELGGVAGFVAAWLGTGGPAYTVSTACSSGAKAVASGRALLALGVCDAVVAGGSDALCRLTANGFTALQAVADQPSNPFSANRRGLTLGEGSAVFLLERRAGGVQVLGAGESSDAFHMSSPDPEGHGAAAAMQQALAEAGLQPADIAYLNLHGTGTPLNDAMESRAVRRVFGDVAVPCSSTKPLVGHTLGAAGAVELAFACMMLERRTAAGLPLPPHCWDGVPDPELPALRFAVKGEHAPAAERMAVLSNSFGFGGNNCAVVLGVGPAW
jgi:3-oxoacyl-[acyl-carrier-protein] synthase-1